MASRNPSFPTRIGIIAGGIVVALVALFLVLNRLGSPAVPVPDPAADPEATDLIAPSAVDLDAGTPTDLAAANTESVTLQLFLVDTATLRLVPRIVRLQAPTTVPAQAQVAVERLIDANPIGYLSPFPPGTKVREVWVSPDGVAYVDFSAGVASLLEQGSTAEILAVYGLIGTLTSSFPEIRLVQLLVGGSPVDSLSGHLDLSAPLGPLADWLY